MMEESRKSKLSLALIICSAVTFVISLLPFALWFVILSLILNACMIILSLIMYFIKKEKNIIIAFLLSLTGVINSVAFLIYIVAV